ncbi:hypothetical protein SAE02_73550 [Skermanella aerolata]|uniref:Uncharacterized protein n=1 Tax=Skermanella aerolata TaxID=393310 RepID=A0A512E3D8_9PROT|nr:hypothetical protein SAE02_73550 [Skermanella aerolata]
MLRASDNEIVAVRTKPSADMLAAGMQAGGVTSEIAYKVFSVMLAISRKELEALLSAPPPTEDTAAGSDPAVPVPPSP